MSKTKTIKGKDPARLWESYIRAECQLLRDQGRADVRKNWEAPKVRGSYTKVETSAPDFGGCAMVHGRLCVPVLMEAKRVALNRLPLSNVSEDQMKDLAFRAKMGGLALLYVLSGKGTKHLIRVSEDGVPDYLSPREGSVILCEENQKSEEETWLDFVERKSLI